MNRKNKQRICIRRISPKQKYIQRFTIAAIKNHANQTAAAVCKLVFWANLQFCLVV